MPSQALKIFFSQDLSHTIIFLSVIEWWISNLSQITEASLMSFFDGKRTHWVKLKCIRVFKRQSVLVKSDPALQNYFSVTEPLKSSLQNQQAYSRHYHNMTQVPITEININHIPCFSSGWLWWWWWWWWWQHFWWKQTERWALLPCFDPSWFCLSHTHKQRVSDDDQQAWVEIQKYLWNTYRIGQWRDPIWLTISVDKH